MDHLLNTRHGVGRRIQSRIPNGLRTSPSNWPLASTFNPYSHPSGCWKGICLRLTYSKPFSGSHSVQYGAQTFQSSTLECPSLI